LVLIVLDFRLSHRQLLRLLVADDEADEVEVDDEAEADEMFDHHVLHHQ
jgi:hypothetical protein